MKYTALIVDDEKHQQEILSGMIRNDFPEIMLQGICSSVEEGLQRIPQLKPDLVFLDVMMPPLTGFDLLSRLEKVDFEIIFCTSYEQYAIRAFQVSAVDYLLKPFDTVQLRAALKRFEERIRLKLSARHVEVLLQNVHQQTRDKTKIALPTRQGFVFVEAGDIIRCESDNVYTVFYFTDRTKLMVSRSIKEWENLLGDFRFFRIHASHLVNMQYVKEYIRGEGGTVRMEDGSEVEVSRRKKEDFLNKLNRL